MDAFFASVEERDNPRLKGKPVAVGADPEGGKGRGVVSTANYKARAYGIHSALPIQTAWRLSEEAKKRGEEPVVFVATNFKNYTETSARIMAIVRTILRGSALGLHGSAIVEQTSVDEAYFDVTFAQTFEEAEHLALQIKNEIKTKERLTCSVGIAPNKLIAKIASDMQKPDGLTVVRPEEVLSFLEPLPIRKIPGIGPKTEALLKKRGIGTVDDIRGISRGELSLMLGKWGEELYKKSRGEDDDPVAEEKEIAKSVGEQETFSHDTNDASAISERVATLAREVFGRFREEGFSEFKCVVITVRFADFETKTKSHTLLQYANSPTELEFETMKLLLPFFDARENPKKKLIRLVGVRVEKLK
jgi:DNA polymerase IV (DinB-like DNA polymerase)